MRDEDAVEVGVAVALRERARPRQLVARLRRGEPADQTSCRSPVLNAVTDAA